MSQPTRPSSYPINAADHVYRLLRDAILNLTLLPGSALSEASVVEQTGVSRTPVRQALQRLEHDQLVRVFPQRGTVVAPLDLQAFREAFFVRVSLETAAARNAAVAATPADCRSLREGVAAQRKAVQKNDHAAFFGMNETFHRQIMVLAGIANVWAVVESAKVHLDRMRAAHLLFTDPYPLAPLVEEHEAIVDALASADATRVDALMRSHLEKVLPRADLLLSRRPDLFAWPAGLMPPERLVPLASIKTPHRRAVKTREDDHGARKE